MRLVLDDDCGVTTRNRPAPRKADEDDTDPILALLTCLAEEEGANASLGWGSVVNTTKKPRPRPTNSRRLCEGIFFYLEIIFVFALSERGPRRSEYSVKHKQPDTLGRGITTRETIAAMAICRGSFASTCFRSSFVRCLAFVRQLTSDRQTADRQITNIDRRTMMKQVRTALSAAAVSLLLLSALSAVEGFR